MKEQWLPFSNGKTGNAHLVFKANDRSYFSIIKKNIHGLAQEIGFNEKKLNEVDLVVAELTTNLIKHANGGELFVKQIHENNNHGIEIVATDNGPGMADVNRMLPDGISSQKTLGLGLGSIKRIADFFQVYSLHDWGTISLVRIFERPKAPFLKPSKTEIKSIAIPKPGETFCGDEFFYHTDHRYIKLFLGDGLGHGIEAHKAVKKAGEAFHSCNEVDPVEMIRYISQQVKKTRGLVGAVAVFDKTERYWHLCGVGNIMTKIAGPTLAKNYLSYNGIIGLNVPRTMNVQTVPYEKGQHIILCSDGIRSRWEIHKFPGLLRYDLSIVSAAIIKDFGRSTDDTSVAVCKINI